MAKADGAPAPASAAGLAVALVSGLLDRRTPDSFVTGERVLAR
jgi:DHA1 family inner membrane transport protein